MTGRSLAKLLSALRPVSNRAAGGPSDEESPMQTYWFDVFTSTTWEELGIHGFTLACRWRAYVQSFAASQQSRTVNDRPAHRE